jgi:trichohyalin
MKELEEERRIQEEIRQENERKRKEEEERIRKEEEEKERIRKEEEERKRKEEEERLRKEEEERQRKEEERKRKEEEERKRKEEEEKQYIREKLADRAEAIKLQQETLNEREVGEYDYRLQSLQKCKDDADKEYNEAKQADDENREKFQKELEKATVRISELEDQIMIQTELTNASLSHIDRFYKENEEKIRKRTDELLSNKKDKTLQKLLQDKEKEDKENATKKWSMVREHKAGKALDDYLAADTELTSLTLQQQVFRNQKAQENNAIAEMQHELETLQQRKPELEKDLKRINHDLEVATTVKKYVDNAIKYYTDNKEEIMSKYASEEIGYKLYSEVPYGKVEFYATPIYETKVSDLQLEESDPEPMKTYIESYDETMHITEEMKQMAL